MKYVIGFDAGGTKTNAVVADESGRILGYGRSAAGNYESIGVQTARSHWLAAGRAAVNQAGIKNEDIEVGCFGLAGADFPEDYEMLYPHAAATGFGKKIFIKNDTMVAFRAGTRCGYGAVVIMGTGTNCAGRSPDGTEIQIGGEGYLYGDYGGGMAMGRELVHNVVRYLQGRGEPTILAANVFRQFKVENLEELLLRFYHDEYTHLDFAELAPCIFDVAIDGDKIARNIVIHAGTEVGLSAGAVMKKLDMLNFPVDIVLGGSLYKARGNLFMDTIKEKIYSLNPSVDIIIPEFEPVIGAVLLALEVLGINIDDKIYSNLSQPIPAAMHNI